MSWEMMYPKIVESKQSNGEIFPISVLYYGRCNAFSQCIKQCPAIALHSALLYLAIL